MDTTKFREDALAFLKENYTTVIATSFNDEPRASTIYYYIDDEFNFYFITKRNTSKYINIEMNPRAAIVVGTGPDHITVQAHGSVELVLEDAEKEKILGRFVEIGKHNNIEAWPIEDLDKFKDRNTIFCKIKPKQVVYMNLDSKKYPNSHSEEYVEVFAAQ